MLPASDGLPGWRWTPEVKNGNPCLLELLLKDPAGSVSSLEAAWSGLPQGDGESACVLEDDLRRLPEDPGRLSLSPLERAGICSFSRTSDKAGSCSSLGLLKDARIAVVM